MGWIFRSTAKKGTIGRTRFSNGGAIEQLGFDSWASVD
jgi:hypothetical protein